MGCIYSRNCRDASSGLALTNASVGRDRAQRSSQELLYSTRRPAVPSAGRVVHCVPTDSCRLASTLVATTAVHIFRGFLFLPLTTKPSCLNSVTLTRSLRACVDKSHRVQYSST